jgi:hypothetical protein
MPMTDEQASRRIAYVHASLALEYAFGAAFVLPDVWDRAAMVTAAGADHHHLGFTPPAIGPAGRPSLGPLVLVCAEVLVGRTTDLTEPEFFRFIDSVVLHLHLHVVELAGDAPTEATEAAVLAEQATVVDRDFALYERLARPESWRSQ